MSRDFHGTEDEYLAEVERVLGRVRWLLTVALALYVGSIIAYLAAVLT